MSNKFFRPFVLWSGMWLLICMVIFVAMWYQNKFYWQNTLARPQTVEFNLLHASLPYALAFLEEHNRPDLIQQTLNSNFGLFTMAYTDLTGKIKFQTQLSKTSPNTGLTTLDRYKSSYVYQTPFPQQWSAKSPLDRKAFYKTQESAAKGPAYGKLYLLMSEPPTFFEILTDRQKWQQAGHEEAMSGYFFNIATYALILVAFGAICLITAKYQTQFQDAHEEQYKSELNARELRIRLLESSLNELNLKQEVLNQDYDRALAISNQAKKDSLAEYQSKAEEAKNLALSIDEERKKLIDEKKELESFLLELKEIHNSEELFPKIKKNKPLQIWLKSTYNNLAFSRRAIQDIIDIQDSPGVFPSLPEALLFLNNIGIDSIFSKEGFPPNRINWYTQALAHFQGPCFEYRFSSDGRIFFGMSKTRVWNIDTVLLKRRLFDNVHRHEKYLADNIGRDNHDLKSG